MAEPRWLDETQQRAWQALLVVFLRGMPEIERTFKANDLLSVQYGILVALADAPDRTLRLSELADLSNTSQSRLTHRLRSLVAKGDIEISSDPADGRAKNATLTPSGMVRLESIAPDHAETVLQVIFDHLDGDQTAALADALSAVAASLCGHEQYRPSRQAEVDQAAL
jgi:DNA-binding MarR family transcriptional regulator